MHFWYSSGSLFSMCVFRFSFGSFLTSKNGLCFQACAICRSYYILERKSARNAVLIVSASAYRLFCCFFWNVSRYLGMKNLRNDGLSKGYYCNTRNYDNESNLVFKNTL